MKRKSALLWVLVLALCLAAVLLALHKTQRLGVPFFPQGKMKTWIVEATVRFDAEGKEVEVDLGLPPVREGAEVRQEVASLGYGYEERSIPGEGRRGRWASRSRKGVQRLYYQISLEAEDLQRLDDQSGPVKVVNSSDLGGSESEMLARETLRRECREKSANPETFVGQLRKRLLGPEVGQEAGFLRRAYEARNGKGWEAVLIQDFLQMEGIANRKAWGVVLNESLGAQLPVPMMEFYDGSNWQAVEAVSEREPGRLVVWSRGASLLDVRGGSNSQVFFTAARSLAPLDATEALSKAPAWIGSIAALPVNERRVFRYIALIPVGAFMIVFLRNLIGINMLGTFMPVLLALSFLEIPLVPALVMFSLLLAVGLFFRFFLSRLNLLVVPRVAACVVVVSLLMIVMGLFSWRMGMTLGLQVTVFPMVVMAWTIERMSILWDEEGPADALRQAGGSLLAAILAYLIMRVSTVDYWAQYFPELLLILLAGILLIGRYTGYRLSELIRFKSFPRS